MQTTDTDSYALGAGELTDHNQSYERSIHWPFGTCQKRYSAPITKNQGGKSVHRDDYRYILQAGYRDIQS